MERDAIQLLTKKIDKISRIKKNIEAMRRRTDSENALDVLVQETPEYHSIIAFEIACLYSVPEISASVRRLETGTITRTGMIYVDGIKLSETHNVRSEIETGLRHCLLDGLVQRQTGTYSISEAAIMLEELYAEDRRQKLSVKTLHERETAERKTHVYELTQEQWEAKKQELYDAGKMILANPRRGRRQ